MDFSIFYISGNRNECPCIQQRVYETRVHDIDELRQRLLHVSHGLEQLLIYDAVGQWPTRLRACVHANGGHFEHAL